MQYIICAIKDCGFCSSSGFCLNRLVTINAQGVCNRLTKPGWEKTVQDWQKSTYKVQKTAAVAQNILEASEKQVQDGPPQEKQGQD